MKRIIAVDDDPDVLKVLDIVLEASGYEVGTAADGIEFRQKVKERKPDLVLMDINLPGESGLELSQKMKADGLKDVPIVLMSSRSDLEAKARRLRIPYLEKPFDIEVLVEKVTELI